MKKTYLLLLISMFIFQGVYGQITNSTVEQMMYRRVLTRDDIDYNTIVLLPKLYREHKADTIQAIIDYNVRSYGMSGLLAPFIIIDRIRTGKFTERLESNYTTDTGMYYKVLDSLHANHYEQPATVKIITDTTAMHTSVEQKLGAARKAFTAAQTQLTDAQTAVVKATPQQKSSAEDNLKKAMAAVAAAVADMDAVTEARFYQDYIISYYLQWYLDNYDIKDSLNYSEFIRKPYAEYFAFLSATATGQLTKPGLTPVEKFLLDFFATPSKQMLAQLTDSEYNGSLLQQAWLDQSHQSTSFQGFHVGLTGGDWLPQGHLTAIGNHPYYSFVIGGRGKNDKFMCDVEMGLRSGASKNSYKVKVNDTAIATNSYIGYYAGINEGFSVWRNYRHEIDIYAGLAWEGFSTTPDTSISSFNSLDFNVGAGYKLFVKHKVKKNNIVHTYLALQAKYHFIHYPNNGGTDLTGNAVTIGLAYGWYSRNVNHHYYIDKW